MEGADGVGPLVHLVLVLCAYSSQALVKREVVGLLHDSDHHLIHGVRGHQLEACQVAELGRGYHWLQVGDVHILNQTVDLLLVKE